MKSAKEELQAQLQTIREKTAEIEALILEDELEKAEALLKTLLAEPGPVGQKTQPTIVPEGSRVMEGVFDGQHMIGADGKPYLVPPNYASKSKLVEGDMMKLSITPQGAFIYKQIGPIDRKRVVCTLTQDPEGMWHASDEVHNWRLLTAAVSYFKGKTGDEVVILIPGDAPSKWAAVENIIAK